MKTLTALAFFVIVDSCGYGPSVTMVSEEVCSEYRACYASDGVSVWRVK